MILKLSKWLAAGAAILAVIVTLLLSGITIPLDFLNSRLESLSADLLGRDVRIQGPVRLRTSLEPSLELGGITIKNPRDWSDEHGYLLKVDRGRAQLSLTELLRGNVSIRDLEFSGVDLQLVTRSNRANNFQFALRGASKDSKAAKHELSSLDRFRMNDLQLSYIDELSKKKYTLEIAEARGQGQPASPLQFVFSGKFGKRPFTLDFTGGTLEELLNKNESWLITEGHLTLADVALNLDGALNLADKGKAGYMNLAVDGHNLDALGDIFDLQLPDIGDFSLATNITLLPGMIQLTTMQLNALHNVLEGELIVDLSGTRPRLAGNITTAELTPEIMTPFQASDEEKPDKGEADKTISAKLPWKILQLVDTDVQIRAGIIKLGNLQINNLKGVFSLVDGDLIMPVSMAIMDLSLDGQIEIATGDPIPEISADVSSPGANLDSLFEVFSSKHELQGQLGALSFKSRSRGNTVNELTKGADIELSLGPTIVRKDSIEIVAAETLSLERIHQQAFSISTSGELLGSPLDFQTVLVKPAATSTYAGSAVHLDMTACNTELLFDGGITDDAKGESAFSLKVKGEKLCGFIEPVERFMGKNIGFATTATGNLNDRGLRVDVERITLGDLSLNGWLEMKSGKLGKPIVSGMIHSKRFDLAHFLQQRDIDAGRSVPQLPQQPVAEQNPVAQTAFEQKIALVKNLLALDVLQIKNYLSTDVHLEIQLDELITDLLSIADIRLVIEAEEGKLRHSPFQARIGGSLFTGSASIDTTTTTPVAHLGLATDDFNLPELLRDFTSSHVPDVRVEHVGLDISFKGETVQEMFYQADYTVELTNGKVVLPRAPQVPLVVNLAQVDYVASQGQPAMVSVVGDINDLYLALQMTGDGFFAKGSDKPVVISLQAELADTRVEIDGQINRKKDIEESFRLSTMLSGKRMDDLNELLGVNMPPLGPYQIEGSLASKKVNSIGLYDMGVRIGDTKLNGELTVSTSSDQDSESGNKPNLQTRLSAQTIQLNDFKFGNWSPLAGNKQNLGNADQEGLVEDQGNIRLYNILSADLAKEVDGSLEIQVEEVLSGQDNLGNGQLRAHLQDGRYIIDNLLLAVPGGTIHMEGGILPERDIIDAELQMIVKHFDYGILARRTKPDSTLKGELNLALNLNTRAKTPSQLKENMNGRVRIGIIPEEYKAKTLDLWAVNILTAALPALLNGNESLVNCLAGDFILEDGLLHPDIFVLDTSKMRVQGKGVVNFKTNEIDFHLKPTPKSAQFFSLATPISVSGTIMKPDIGVTPASVLGTVFRQAISIVTVPLQWLFTDNLETDGTKVCSAAMQWVDEGSALQQKKPSLLKTSGAGAK